MTNQNDLVGFYAVDAFDEAIERPFTGYNLDRKSTRLNSSH